MIGAVSQLGPYTLGGWLGGQEPQGLGVVGRSDFAEAGDSGLYGRKLQRLRKFLLGQE